MQQSLRLVLAVMAWQASLTCRAVLLYSRTVSSIILMHISIENLRLTATLLCRLLMKVPQVLSRKCEIEVGYFLSIPALRALLSSVSTPTRRWTVERSPQSCVIIGYSNPVYTDMPNALMYEFPCMQRNPLTRDESWALILLHPVAASQRAYGLYFDEDGIKQDLLADWESFWHPLHEALVKLTRDPCSQL